ncbi:MAG: homoserine dehydrogenase [Dehalococcoidia bacterium]|nr:homoserine dehydrogenase [Dehalococcoidia bacterium]
MKQRSSINIGLMGLGVVGGGVASILPQKSAAMASQIGYPLVIKKILVRDLNKQRSVQVQASLLTTDARDILDDPEIDIVIEVIGGETPAHSYVMEALRKGKHVVTANKEVMAKHGPELLVLAKEKAVDILYEASVGGGIPIIAPFKHDLTANKITAVHAIINGTTNYILTRMAKENLDFAVALEEAKALGYAEADPTNDVEGYDAAYKLSILATLAFGQTVRPSDLYCEGITKLTARDFRYAKELGYTIKLVAIAKEVDGAIEARIHPTFLPEDLMLAKVDGVFNAIHVEGDLVGKVLFYGQGAGALPTSSAIVADVIEVASNIAAGVGNRLRVRTSGDMPIRPMSAVETCYYLRLNVNDRAGVLAQIASTLGDNNISIAYCIQKEADAIAQTAEIVIMTHLAREAGMQKALQALRELSIVKEIGNFVRVERQI